MNSFPALANVFSGEISGPRFYDLDVELYDGWKWPFPPPEFVGSVLIPDTHDSLIPDRAGIRL